MELNFERILKLFRKNLITIIAITLVAAVIACVYSVYFIQPRYTSSARFKIGIEVDPESKTDTLQYASRIANLVDEVIGNFNSDDFYSDLSEALDGNYGPSELPGMISFAIEGEGTTYFNVNVVANNAADAKAVIDQFSVIGPKYIKDTNYSQIRIILMRRGRTPGAPSSPNIPRNTVLGMVVGFALSCGIVFLRDLLDRRVKTTADLVERFGYPILGIVPRFDIDSSKESSGGKEEKK